MTETLHLIIFIAIMAVCTFLTRALPFLILGGLKDHPLLIYMGRYLPPAVMTILVLYVLRDVNPLDYSYGLPEAASVAMVVGLHLWRGNALLSIAGGTGLYMFLRQAVFA